jgi:hypothetical protein
MGVIILAAQSSTPAERQMVDDPSDERTMVVVFAIWARTRARADAIRARIQQLVCFGSPALATSVFFRLARRIRPGPFALQTRASGNALAELHLYPDTKQVATDPTRWT